MFHCHPCIFPCVFLNLWSQEEVRTCPNSDLWSQEEVRTWRKSEFWSNLARFESRNGILTKWSNDSASFLLEKLKNHVVLTKNLNIWQKNSENTLKTFKNTKKSMDFHGFPLRSHCGATVDPLDLIRPAAFRFDPWLHNGNPWKSIDFFVFFCIFEVFSGFEIKY